MNLFGKRKYVSIQCSKDTSDKLRLYCYRNGFRLDLTYSGEKQMPMEFDFHTTIFYTETKHKGIANDDYLMDPIRASVTGTKIFGIDRQVPVLLVESPEILKLRKKFASQFGMKDNFKVYYPHISLSYEDITYDLSKLILPQFPIYYDILKVDDVD